jgi:hypothetical protein
MLWKDGCEWEYKPHPKIAAIAAAMHIDKNMV